MIAGCATRPVNQPIARFEPKTTYTFERPSANPEDRQHFVLLAFSGGGTRAAAFSYGAPETLRDMEITTKSGRRVRALDEVDVITGVSGGSLESPVVQQLDEAGRRAHDRLAGVEVNLNGMTLSFDTISPVATDVREGT